MKISEKDKEIEIKLPKEEKQLFSFKKEAVTEAEKALLLVYYSYLKNIS